jgi:glycosyltransferase involved in cell wall biosynthesis
MAREAHYASIESMSTPDAASRKVMMIAFHFPPMKGSSGIQRTLKFARYLPENGWRPIVLSTHPRAYERTSGDQIHEIGPDVIVERAFALDAARHLAIRGRYLKYLALPDRWVSWMLGAVPLGLRLIRAHRPELIWSTFPIATAHLIGYVLHRLSGLPWVADFRDSMTEPDYPHDRQIRAAYARIERAAVARASALVFVTPGAERMYSERYPALAHKRRIVIPNGFDEENFRSSLGRTTTAYSPASRLTLLHSGLLDPFERDPRPFLDALARLREAGHIKEREVRVVWRATGHDARYAPELRARGLEHIVELAPPLDYAAALSEMMSVDALLVFQSNTCNHQIPAKIYEYLRAGRPILAMTDPAGDTARTLREAGVQDITPLHDVEAIAAILPSFLARLRSAEAPILDSRVIASYSRRRLTADLAALFESLTPRSSEVLT